MNIVAAIFHEALGLFVDDEGLALSILGVVAVAIFVVYGLGAPAALAGAVLLLGCVGALIVSALRAGRR